MTFTSYAVMLIGRFLIRLTFYVTLRSKLFKRKNSTGIKITMIAFHRPFRRLAKVSTLIEVYGCIYLFIYLFITFATTARSQYLTFSIYERMVQ